MSTVEHCAISPTSPFLLPINHFCSKQWCVEGGISALENPIIEILVSFHSRREQMSPNWVFFTSRIVTLRLSWKKISLTSMKLKCFILILTLKYFRLEWFLEQKLDLIPGKLWPQGNGIVWWGKSKNFSSAKLGINAPRRSGVRMESCTYGSQ